MKRPACTTAATDTCSTRYLSFVCTTKCDGRFSISVHSAFYNAHSSLCLACQVLPASANGGPGGHREDIPLIVRGVFEPGRVQDPLPFDVAYQGVVDYYPQPPVGVSNSHLSTTEPPFDQRHLGNRTVTLYMCSLI